MSKKRNIQVSKKRSQDAGACCACLDLCDQYGKLRQEEVWLIELAGVKVRLCDDCLGALLQRVPNSKEAELRKQADFWQQAAIWMADCHAANRAVAELYRTSKSNRERFASIMRTCVQWLRGETASKFRRKLPDIIDRLERNADAIGGKE